MHQMEENPREEEHGEESYVYRKVPHLGFEPGGFFSFLPKEIKGDQYESDQIIFGPVKKEGE